MQNYEENSHLPNLLLKKQQVKELIEKIRQKRLKKQEANLKLQNIHQGLLENRVKIRTISTYQQDLNRLNIVLEDVQHSVETMSILQLNEITKYNNPPEVIKIALEGILFLLRGRKMTWLEIRKEISKGNFIKQMLRFNVGKADHDILRLIQNDYILLEKWNLERLKKASKAMGPLGEWLQCQVELFDASTKSPNAVEFLGIREKLGELEENELQYQSLVEENEAEAEELEIELAQLELEVEQLELISSSPEAKASFVTKKVRFAEGSYPVYEGRAKLSLFRNSDFPRKDKTTNKLISENFFFVQKKVYFNKNFCDFCCLIFDKSRIQSRSFSISPNHVYANTPLQKFMVDEGTERLSIYSRISRGVDRISIVNRVSQVTNKIKPADHIEQGIWTVSPVSSIEQGTSISKPELFDPNKTKIRNLENNNDFKRQNNEIENKEIGTKIQDFNLQKLDQANDPIDVKKISALIQTNFSKNNEIHKNTNFSQIKIPLETFEFGTKMSVYSKTNQLVDPITCYNQSSETQTNNYRPNSIENNLQFNIPKNPLTQINTGTHKRTLISHDIITETINDQFSLDFKTEKYNLTQENLYNFQQQKNEKAYNEIATNKMSGGFPVNKNFDFAYNNAPVFKNKQPESFQKLSVPRQIPDKFAENYLENNKNEILQTRNLQEANLNAKKNIQDKSVQTAFENSRFTFSDQNPAFRHQEIGVFLQNNNPSVLTNQTFQDSIQQQNSFNSINLLEKTTSVKSLYSKTINPLNYTHDFPKNNQHEIPDNSNHNFNNKTNPQFQNQIFQKVKVNSSESKIVEILNPKETNHFFILEENRLSKSVPKFPRNTNSPTVFRAVNQEYQTTSDINIDNHFNKNNKSDFGDLSVTIKTQADQNSLSSKTTRSVFNKSFDKEGLIGIRFVDHEKNKITEHSFDEKNKIEGNKVVIGETINLPLVGFVKHRETFQIKKMLAQNPNLKLEELNDKKFGVTYRFLQNEKPF